MISSGLALVVTSQSFGSLPITRSRTHPPTKYASNPAFSSVSVTYETSLGIFDTKLLLKFLEISIYFKVHPEGLEPPTTVPKTVVISISPWVQNYLIIKIFYTISEKLANNAYFT